MSAAVEAAPAPAPAGLPPGIQAVAAVEGIHEYRLANGLQLLQTLLLDVRLALMHGLQEIFFWSAAIMVASILLHLMLKRVPLRARAATLSPPAAGEAR